MSLSRLYVAIAASFCFSIFSFRADALVISEVFYDPVGADDGLEWLELYNPTASSIDLSGYRFASGGSRYSFNSVGLSGVIGSGAYFVVGGPRSDQGVRYDLAIDFSPNIQNSGTTADGVALFSATDVLLDAVIYGVENSNALADENGANASVDVGDAPSGSSIERLTLAGNWHVLAAPTPGSGPLQVRTPTDATVDEPGVVGLFLLGAILLLWQRRKTLQIRGRTWRNIINICSWPQTYYRTMTA